MVWILFPIYFRFDPRLLLHGQQYIEICKPLPSNCSVRICSLILSFTFLLLINKAIDLLLNLRIDSNGQTVDIYYSSFLYVVDFFLSCVSFTDAEQDEYCWIA